MNERPRGNYFRACKLLIPVEITSCVNVAETVSGFPFSEMCGV